jgi:hypothetical protein
MAERQSKEQERRVTLQLEEGAPSPAQTAAWREIVAWLLDPLDVGDGARDTLGNTAKEGTA